MLKNSEDTDSDNAWGERMKKVRVVEFWTCIPSGPAPSTEERIRILAQYRASNHFERRLGAYSIPLDFSDDQIISWDGTPAK